MLTQDDRSVRQPLKVTTDASFHANERVLADMITCGEHVLGKRMSTAMASCSSTSPRQDDKASMSKQQAPAFLLAGKTFRKVCKQGTAYEPQGSGPILYDDLASKSSSSHFP